MAQNAMEAKNSRSFAEQSVFASSILSSMAFQKSNLWKNVDAKKTFPKMNDF